MGLLAAIGTLVAAGVLYQFLGTRRDRQRFQPPGTLIPAERRGERRRLHVRCQPGGTPPVVFESAVGASALSWVRLQPAVASFTRACAYDRAGLGWSDALPRALCFDRIVDDLSTVLDHATERNRCVLVGHSFGTFVICAYAARHPERVAGLVLIEPPLEWQTLTRERARLLRGGAGLCSIGALLARLGVVRACLSLLTHGVPAAPRGFVKIFGPTAAHTLERMVGEVRKLPPEVHPVVQALWCQPKCFRALGQHLRVLAREATAMDRPLPPRVPAVVVSSGLLSAEDLAAHAALARQSAGGRHVVATRSGHWVPFDEPELVVEAVRELVDAERRAGGRNG